MEGATAAETLLRRGPTPNKRGGALPTKTNCDVIRESMSGITRHTRNAIVILITNPLDTMVYIAENE